MQRSLINPLSAGVEPGMPMPATDPAQSPVQASLPEPVPEPVRDPVPDPEQGPALRPGQRLRALEVRQVLAAGGTTTVYAALDTLSGQPVVIKEYLPRSLAQRQPDGQVQPLTPQSAALFGHGLQSFLNEARLLMAVDHPALVKVLQFWEQAGTAYQVMPWAPGATLQQWLAGLGTPPSEAWLRELLAPLMQALEALHRHGGHHGDVSLQSIWLQFDNRADSYLGQKPRPLLLGFGAAGHALARANDGLATAQPGGFGPVEQLDGEITVRQGAWTDVYSLCAVMYAAICGRPPPPSLARMARDDMVSARKVGHGRYSPAFLAAIDAGLVVRPHDRVQSMAMLRQRLDEPAAGFRAHSAAALAAARSAVSAGRAAVTAPMALADLPPPPSRHGADLPVWTWPAALGALLLLLALLGGWLRS